MKIAVGIVIAILILLLIQGEISQLQSDNRKQKCSIVERDGKLFKATYFDYYECMGRK